MSQKEKFITVRYWAKILRLAREYLFSDTKEAFIKYGKYLLALLVFLCLAALGVISNNELIQFTSNLFSDLVFDIKFILALLSASIILAFILVPPKLDKEQRDKIEQLGSNNNKIHVEKFNYYNPSDYTEFKTGITIHNKNSIPFTDIVIELLETNWRKLDQEGNIFLTEKIGVLADNSHFKNWANGNINSIGAKDKETIYFHEIEKGVAVALLEKRKEIFEYKEFSADGKAIGFIEIVFEVRGKVGDEHFEKRYSQLIEYRSTKIKDSPNNVLVRISTIDCHSVLVCESEVLEIVKSSLAQ